MSQDQSDSQADYQLILSEVRNGVLYITMNRPESLNAANAAMLLEMQAALKNAATDPAVRCIVVTGAGRGFCSGADLKETVGEVGFSFKEHLDHTFNPVVRLMMTIEKPVITAVNGVAAGAGASIALAGDIRLWSETASFVEAFSNIALIPDAGSTWLLPRVVGYHKAFELMALATKVLAPEGLRLGLCEHIYSANELMEQTTLLAERLAAGPTKALGLTKRALRTNMAQSFEAALETEGDIQELAGNSHDFREGVAAFLEKRPVKFKGE
jgi:2-(1,2-epoxy-1,2-dihydrophenyl)acetyl-CoA isomerase